ncbi:MAG TPA: hypothetical protein VEK73_12470 [Xanthobacteraceae bacterium]|nr:hypothetical protein [Xanthobacteraceae bacterium]
MTDVAAVISATPIAEGEFRIGRVFSRTAALLSRNFPTFFLVTVVASLPSVLITESGAAQSGGTGGALALPLVLLLLVLGTLSQAIVLHGAFQDMRGRPVNLFESLGVGFRRLLAIIGLALSVGFAVGFASLLLVVPGLILLTMWYVATPACIVERLGVFASMRRSSALTKGHRWQVFGMMLLICIAGFIVGSVIQAALAATGGAGLVVAGSLIWNGAWAAFSAVLVVVTYHDLRVAKEGIDIEQIAAVFD